MPRPKPKETRRKKRYGKCRICLKFGKLTKEHVPPKRAFNNEPYLRNYVEEIKNTEELLWLTAEEKTGGRYVFTLCEKCNNRTGRIYGQSYVELAESLLQYATFENVEQIKEIKLKQIFPLRIIKQVVSLMLSTSKPSSFNGMRYQTSQKLNSDELEGISHDPPNKDRLESIYKDLRDFTKNKDRKGLPTGVKIFTFISPNKVGFNTDINCWIDLKTKKAMWFTVTGMFPVHWVMTFENFQNNKSITDISSWADFGYKQRKTIDLSINCNWLVSKYPIDFRNPQTLRNDHFINYISKIDYINPKSNDITEQCISFVKKYGEFDNLGFLLVQFERGIFYEYGGINGWIPEGNELQARLEIRFRLQNKLLY
ncbi:MAG: hypothetical protein M3405_14770 [Acidobacteriota bacterium]|jgi:hypothetical protein|nr:hypothetical protein [Acidobacteriota bacterium]